MSLKHPGLFEREAETMHMFDGTVARVFHRDAQNEYTDVWWFDAPPPVRRGHKHRAWTFSESLTLRIMRCACGATLYRKLGEHYDDATWIEERDPRFAVPPRRLRLFAWKRLYGAAQLVDGLAHLVSPWGTGLPLRAARRLARERSRR